MSRKVRFDILERDDFTCRYCGRKAPSMELEVDHIQPRSHGGKNDPINLVTACIKCNRGKAARILVGSLPPVVAVEFWKRRYQMELGTWDPLFDPGIFIQILSRLSLPEFEILVGQSKDYMETIGSVEGPWPIFAGWAWELFREKESARKDGYFATLLETE